MRFEKLLGVRRRSDSVSFNAACGVGCAMLVAGAGLTYFLDPAAGRRRRKMIGDEFVRGYHKTLDGADATGRDLKNRTTGVFAGLRSLFGSAAAPDHVVEDRVRSRLGRVASHPRAIQVDVVMGCATLTGLVPAGELADVVSTVSKTPGVNGVKDQLQRAAPGSTPALQGGGRPAPGVIDVARDNWAPATRVLIGGAGAGMMTYCLVRRDIPAILIGSLGFALFVRAASNLPARRLVGVGAGHRAVEVQKTINIDAPVDVVYGFWSNYDNFPLFMHNVKEVRDTNDGFSHWTVAGPAGMTVEWDAILTDLDINRRIAWESVAGSTVDNAGEVCFVENPDGSTRVDVRLSYNPPAGAIGHAVASLFGSDAKSEIDQDLLRMKTLIEQARFPHDAAKHAGDAGAATPAAPAAEI
jgi:uncharacterized membrane protein